MNTPSSGRLIIPNIPLRAGVARRIISPRRGIYLIGYGDRTSGNIGIHDDLTATALALDDGDTCALIVACDLLAINEQTVARVQEQVGENVIICCSHTHSGPVTYADAHSPHPNREYLDFLISQIVAVIHEAKAALQPACLEWTQTEAHIAVNRRERKPGGGVEIGVNPQGLIDPSTLVLQVKALEAGRPGIPLATLVNYPCHGTVLGPKNLLVSADWIGAMRRQVEVSTNAPAMFLQGATGDLNPDHAWGDDDWEAVERLGNAVAQVVLAALPGLTLLIHTSINFTSRQVWLPLATPASQSPTPKVEGEAASLPPKTYRAVLSKLAHVPRFLVDPILNTRYPWYTAVEARQGAWAVPLQMSLLRMGDLAVVGLGAEVFTGIGMEIKAGSPVKHTLLACLSNGCIGYLPSAEEQPLGGYEVDTAPYFYRLPGVLQRGAAQLVIEAVLEMLNYK